MDKLFIILSISLLCAAALFAQNAPKPTVSTPIDTLRVEAEGGKSLQLKAPDLARLPRREVKAKDRDGKESTYSGVELREVLKLKVKADAGSYVGNMGADGCAYTLRLESDQWKVISRETCWVS